MSTVQLIDRLWLNCEAALNGGISNEVFVPVVLITIIGKQGIDDIAARFSKFIQAKATIIEDAAHNVIIKRAPELHGDRAIITSGSKPNYASEKKSKIPRSPNAFILYRQRHHPLVKAEHPELNNTQISIVLGTQWKHESEDTKVKFQRMAEALKQKHIKDHPDYQYQPRKPADRKRRMTRAKIAALNTATLPSTELAATTSAPIEPAPLHKFAQTGTGNTILDIGHPDLEDEMFKQMLNEYNHNVQPMWAQVGHNVNINGHSAVLSTGVTEEASFEENHYASLFDLDDKLESADDLAAEMEVRLQDATTAAEMWAATGVAQLSPSALKSFNNAYGTSEEDSTNFPSTTNNTVNANPGPTNYFAAELARMSTIFVED